MVKDIATCVVCQHFLPTGMITCGIVFSLMIDEVCVGLEPRSYEMNLVKSEIQIHSLTDSLAHSLTPSHALIHFWAQVLPGRSTRS